jgi:Flp pilus assembly protein TadB
MNDELEQRLKESHEYLVILERKWKSRRDRLLRLQTWALVWASVCTGVGIAFFISAWILGAPLQWHNVLMLGLSVSATVVSYRQRRRARRQTY